MVLNLTAQSGIKFYYKAEIRLLEECGSLSSALEESESHVFFLALPGGSHVID